MTHFGKTSDSSYQFGAIVSHTNAASSNQTSTVTITPYLCHSSGTLRRQHRWTVTFTADSNTKYAQSKIFNYHGPDTNMSNYLPNNKAMAGTVESGKMIMTVGVYYQWGNAHSFTINNDGKSHTFTVKMECLDTIPRTCELKFSITCNNYSIIPAAPSNFTATKDEHSITYEWDKVDTKKVKNVTILQKLYYTDGSTKDVSNTYSNSVTTATITYAKNVSKVVYSMVNNSVDGRNSTGTTDAELTFPTDCKVWIKVGDDWVKAIPWVKTDKGWKKASNTYVKVNGTWKRTIM